MIKHLIFDFDGTISDSYPHFSDIFRKYGKEHGLPLPENDEELLRLLLISTKDAFYLLGWNDRIPYPEFQKEFFALQSERAMQYQVFPEAKKLLEYATQNGLKCYIYTHSGEVVEKKMLPNMGIDSMITFTINKSMGFPIKPSPDALLFLIDKFSLNPDECMMIGDRPIDAQCGINAGMKGCLWDTYGIFENEICDVYVRKLEDVKNYL
ncbi:MAG: HAD hydrolase-like protein [Clostridia bacterium]|nr:HAD hydrolase-like protein [Clostridia bacterium]